MLALEALLGRVFAGDFRDRAQPEWPPHPSRLFSAFVAAYHEAHLGDRVRSALVWLEQQAPPAIWAGKQGESSRVTCFVPTNYVESGVKNALRVLPARRTKQPRPFVSQSPDCNRIYFVWPGAEPPAEVRSCLQELATRVGYLGKAGSVVRVRLTDSIPSPNLSRTIQAITFSGCQPKGVLKNWSRHSR